MSKSSEERCFLCESPVYWMKVDRQSHSEEYRCEYCGDYRIDRAAKRKLRWNKNKRMKAAMVAIERTLQGETGLVLTGSDSGMYDGVPGIKVEDFILQAPMTPKGRFDRALMNVSHRFGLNSMFHLDRLPPQFLFATSREEFVGVVEGLLRDGCISHASSLKDYFFCRLTALGWQKAEQIKHCTGETVTDAQTTAHIPMQSHEETDSAETEMLGNTANRTSKPKRSVFYIAALFTIAAAVCTVFGISLRDIGSVFGISCNHPSELPSSNVLLDPLQQRNSAFFSNMIDGLHQDRQSLLHQLRRTRGLRSLYLVEANLHLYEVPSGVYGFVRPFNIESLVDGSERLGRDENPYFFELHKLQDNAVYLIGFVDSSTYLSIVREYRSDTTTVVIFSVANHEAAHPVSVPLSSILDFEYRIISSGLGTEPIVAALDIRLLPSS
jgi:hypothetical protein